MQLLQRYRFLMIIYLPAAVVAMYEVRRGVEPAPQSQLADVLGELDPNSKNANYFKGLLAIERHQPVEARRYFERALAASDNDEGDERLLRYYAMVLIGLDEDRALIDAAVAHWRRRFPRSIQPDPRTIDPQRIRRELRSGLHTAADQARAQRDSSY